jgi:hypothetical protein
MFDITAYVEQKDFVISVFQKTVRLESEPTFHN